MSKKPKYKVVRPTEDDGPWRVSAPNKAFICWTYQRLDARKIARALNAMEPVKPKAKPFKFDWSGIDPKYKWAAMDEDGVWGVFKERPIIHRDAWVWDEDPDWINLGCKRPIYPGNWRDSLQKQP